MSKSIFNKRSFILMQPINMDIMIGAQKKTGKCSDQIQKFMDITIYLEVMVTAAVNPETGFMVDLDELKDIVKNM